MSETRRFTITSPEPEAFAFGPDRDTTGWRLRSDSGDELVTFRQAIADDLRSRIPGDVELTVEPHVAGRLGTRRWKVVGSPGAPPPGSGGGGRRFTSHDETGAVVGNAFKLAQELTLWEIGPGPHPSLDMTAVLDRVVKRAERLAREMAAVTARVRTAGQSSEGGQG